MRSISELDNTRDGSDIYIAGTGPSLRVFPTEYLDDKYVIGLNKAWSCVKTDLNITIHPDLNLPDDFTSNPSEMNWVIPREKSQNLLNNRTFKVLSEYAYEFRYDIQPDTSEEHDPSNVGRVKEILLSKNDSYLYLWSSIAQSAMHLAARMGAKNIFLIGCDNNHIRLNDHAKPQHTRWKGVDPSYRYGQYSEGMSEVRNELYKIGVNTFNLSSLLGVGHAELEFERLCKLKQVDLIQTSQPLKEKNLIRKLKRKLNL